MIQIAICDDEEYFRKKEKGNCRGRKQQNQHDDGIGNPGLRLQKTKQFILEFFH